MRRFTGRWLLLGFAGAFGAASSLTTGNPAVSLIAAFAAVASASAFGALSLLGRTRFEPWTYESPSVDRLAALQTAFREGPLGRQRIVEAIIELQRGSGHREARPTGTGSSPHPETQSGDPFRRWVAEQLDQLERST